jgi:preprotein translocase subunit YajC
MSAVRTLQTELREGDQVMTTSGIYGRIAKLGEDDARLEIAPNLEIRVARGAIGQIFKADDDAGADTSED